MKASSVKRDNSRKSWIFACLEFPKFDQGVSGRAECTPVMTGVTGVRTLVRIEIFSAPQSVLRGAPQSDLGVQQLHPSQNCLDPSQNWLHPSQLTAPQSTVNHIF